MTHVAYKDLTISVIPQENMYFPYYMAYQRMKIA